MTQHDVVIIGGSLAGAACGRELERLGIDAVALERDRFPRAKVCGGFVSPGAVKCLEQLGVLADVRAAGAVEVSAALVAVGRDEIEIPFQRPGLGVSRSTLDGVLARGAQVRQGCSVREVKAEGRGFRVDEIACSAVIDASGKLSRFTKRRPVEEFGVQYLGDRRCGSMLEFSFFDDGYGGTISVEGGKSNSCFLIKKDGLRRYLGRRDCLVTGPLAYERVPGEVIAIGDAAGMVDPFCGEGMRHALETGMLAAQVVARGIRAGAYYQEMKLQYESAYKSRWAARRALGAMIRRLVSHQRVFASVLRATPAWLLNRIWE
jgi:flavin-dependent dehydrogenase